MSNCGCRSFLTGEESAFRCCQVDCSENIVISLLAFLYAVEVATPDGSGSAEDLGSEVVMRPDPLRLQELAGRAVRHYLPDVAFHTDPMPMIL